MSQPRTLRFLLETPVSDINFREALAHAGEWTIRAAIRLHRDRLGKTKLDVLERRLKKLMEQKTHGQNA